MEKRYFVPNGSEKIDITNCEDVCEVVNQVYGYTVYADYEYTENFLADLPTDDEGAIDATKLSDEQIHEFFNSKEQMEKFLNSANSIVLRGNGETIFVCSNENVQPDYLAEQWLEERGSFIL